MNLAQFFRNFHISVTLCMIIKISSCSDHSDSYEDFYQEEMADFGEWLQMKIRHHEIEIPRRVSVTASSLASEGIPPASIVSDTFLDRGKDVKSSPYEKDSSVSTIIPLSAIPKIKPSDRTDVISKGLPVDGKNNSFIRDHGYSKVFVEAPDDYHRIHKDEENADDYDQQSNSKSAHSLSSLLSSLISHSKFEGDVVIKAVEISSSRYERDDLHFDTCSADNNVLSEKQMCPSSSQYNIERHLSSKYSDAMRTEMMEKTKIPMQHPEDHLCNYGKHLGPERGVNERALCPFRWVVSPRNEARIPEYLLMAECACPESRGGKHHHRARCVEVWSKIRVLWQVSCNGNNHTYREGWEEIPVACAPIGRYISRIKPGINVNLKFPK